jgi:hypothetical protein
MKKSIIALSLALVFLSQAPSASALSCLPVDMYLDTVPTDETTFVFIGTATEVKNHTQVITVSESLKGWVAPQVWVTHPHSTDWGYFCSNGPAKAGEETIFLVNIDQYGRFNVSQTLDADSKMGKDFLEDIRSTPDVDGGITEVTTEDHVSEVRQMIYDLLKALTGMLTELHYWQSKV